jgi:hypothetical protein
MFGGNDMRKKKASYLNTKKRTNPLLVLAIIAAIILVYGIIHYARNYNELEERRHRTIEDILEAVEHPTYLDDEEETKTSGVETTTEDETTTEE